MATLPSVIEDVQLGIESTHGFRAFFRYDGAKQYVHDILLQVLRRETKMDMAPDPTRPTSPRFACAQENSLRYYPWMSILRADPWIICTTTTQAAFTFVGTAYVWLCPSFFNYPTKPRELTGRNCPKVERNRFINDYDGTLERFQSYIALHEMIHFYLQAHSLSGTSHPPEQYEKNGCVGLRPLNALHNPTSYQAYVASKWSLYPYC